MAKPEKKSDEITNRGRILLVEDFEDTVVIIKRLLERNGFHVEPAFTINEARKKLEGFIPDTIVLDINLPDGSGLDFLRDLKGSHEDIPVIMLTAYTELENAIRSLQHGVDDFIPKPFDNTYLLHSIKKAIEKAKLKYRLRQSEKFRVLGELASGVAHDFNNLLHSMSSHLYLLEKRLEEKTEAVNQHLKALKTAISDAGEIVKRLSSMGRSGDDERKLVDLSALIQDTILMTRPKWHHEPNSYGKSINLETKLEPDLYIMANPAEMREVITNLIFNAVDAMPAGGEIVISARKDGDSISVIVEDTGLGMDKEILSKIFDPFFTTKGHGSGLGLSISYAIIQKHGGDIEVRSTPGKGTIFHITLPAVKAGVFGASV